MKTLLFVFSFSTAVYAAPLAFEPYVDAKLECLFIVGTNTRLPLAEDVTTVEQAVEIAAQSVGQNLQLTCNQDRYECIHKDGDVRPEIVFRQSVEKNLKVVGGRILDLQTGREVARIGNFYFHQNLRRLPRCKY